MEVDESDNADKNAGTVPDSKAKGKRKLYVGSQTLGYRRDHMEVSQQSNFRNVLAYITYIFNLRY